MKNLHILITAVVAVLFLTAFNFATFRLFKNDELLSNDLVSNNLDTRVHSKDKERAPDDSKFVHCMLHLEKEVMNQNQINAWDRDQVMIPTSVKIIDNRYWILGYNRKGNVYYKCNGFDGAKVQGMNRQTRALFALQCPSSVDPRNTTLSTVSSFDVANKTIVQTYNMNVFDDCERKDIEEMFVKKTMHISRNSSLSLPNDMKIGITAMFHRERRKAMEWAAYHHAIGVDHIWLYVNEDWDNARDLPQRDYVTWVPWNFHLSNEVRKQVYGGYIEMQAMSQNDALYRAKRLGFEWLATIDIDEYLVLNNGKSAGTTKPLKEYFHSLKESSVPHNSIQSVRLTSVPFGSDQKQAQELLIDHVYRRFIDIDDEHYIRKGRWKHILNVKLATAINIHYIVGKSHVDRASVIRINHYKKPEVYGVFQSNGNLTKETWFRDNFRSVIENEMKSIQYPNSTY